MLSGMPVRGALASARLAKKIPEDARVILLPVFRGEEGPELPLTGLLDATAARDVLSAAEAISFEGKPEDLAFLPAPGSLPASSGSCLALMGLGDASNFDAEVLRRAMGAAARRLRSRGPVLASLGKLGEGSTEAAVEGYLLGSYCYTGQRHTTAAKPGTLTLLASGKKNMAAVQAAIIRAEAVALARDLTNTSARDLYPASYADALSALATEHGVESDIYDAHRLSTEGFGGILAVGSGSQRPPHLVRLHWTPADREPQAHVALVGKGITFDTGGISLKPAANMEVMVSDMGGSAAVAASVFAAARLELPVKLTAWLPLAENMPSGVATRPGDVITHYGGTTSEIINTDAEGRLVLADALARAAEDRPDAILEASTLTGGQLVALGTRTTGVMGSPELRDLVAQSGREVGEAAWAMPLLEEHEEALRSPVADVRNTHNSRNGQMLFAGSYLSRFIPDGIEWAHLDVAGPSWNTESAYGYTPRRATGAPVRTLLQVLSAIARRETPSEDA